MAQMGMVSSRCEIVELDDSDSRSVWHSQSRNDVMSKDGKRYAMEEDINRLFEAVIKASGRESGQQVSREALIKKAMKKPVRAGSSPSSSMGVSAPVSLKQALRGICISQASELAAMRRLSKPRVMDSSGVPEARSGGKIYKVLQSLETDECSYPVRCSKENIIEVSLVPEVNLLGGTVNQSFQFPVTSVLDPAASTSAAAYATVSKAKVGEKLRQLGKAKIHAEVGYRKPIMDIAGNRPLRAAGTSCTSVTDEKVSSVGIVIVSTAACITSDKDCGSKVQCAAKPSIQLPKNELTNKSAQLIKPFPLSKNKPRKKADQDPCSSSSSCSFRPNIEVNLVPTMGVLPCESHSYTPNVIDDGNTCSVPNGTNHQDEDSFDTHHPSADYMAKLKCTESRSKAIGDISRSTKSSIGDFSSITSISEESSFSRSSLSSRRPHMSKDPKWEAIHHVQKLYGNLSSSHFGLLKKLGCGDIGTVYLAELRSTNSLFAIKVMDTEFLNSMNKMSRARTEREIMQMLDHPFLPTLYAYLTTDKFSCLVMEYCHGGDLHVLRQRQPGRCFSEYAARFYGAEILLALEYLHLQGVLYRDLKPENILVRDDGHIMLTDFDLSLRCSVHPTLIKTKSGPASTSPKKTMLIKTSSTCMDPFGIQLMWQVPCLTPKTSPSSSKTKNLNSDPAAQVGPLPQLIVEPTNTRSNSFVGTHEYLAPEIIKGEGHGNAVDWWMFGIFLYELLYSQTPFKGETNEETLANVVSQPLTFPQTPIVSFHAKDFIQRLLTKEPENRLGSLRGAAEIKQHAFFQGINWALVRCTAPPVLPSLVDSDSFVEKRKLPKEVFELF